MENVFKITKRSIIAILTLCLILGIAGTCVNVTAMAAETSVNAEEIVETTSETTVVATDVITIATEESTVVTEYTTPELMPMMARACWGSLDEGLNHYIGKNNWSYDANGSPQANGFDIYVHNGYCRVTGDDVSYSFRFV